jgi:hypothetical protein
MTGRWGHRLLQVFDLSRLTRHAPEKGYPDRWSLACWVAFRLLPVPSCVLTAETAESETTRALPDVPKGRAPSRPALVRSTPVCRANPELLT